MAKHQSNSPIDLPLFDFPMESGASPHEDSENPQVDAASAPEARPKQKSTAADLPLEAAADLPLAGNPGGEEEIETPTPTAVPDNGSGVRGPVPLAGRAAAGLADLAIQSLLIGATMVIVILMGVPLSLSDWPPFTLLALVFSCFYWMVPLAFWGQTPGMTWIGLLSRARDHQSLTFRQTFLRWLGALLTTLLAGLPFLLALGGKPSLGDLLSRTKTVAVEPRVGTRNRIKDTPQ